jgi:hypothetical protein
MAGPHVVGLGRRSGGRDIRRNRAGEVGTATISSKPRKWICSGVDFFFAEDYPLFSRVLSLEMLRQLHGNTLLAGRLEAGENLSTGYQGASRGVTGSDEADEATVGRGCAP